MKTNKPRKVANKSSSVWRMITGLIVSPMLTTSVLAAVSTWNGGSSTNADWSDANNWGGTAVVVGNSLIFSGTARQTNTNDLSGLSLGQVAFTTAGFNISGNAVILSGAFSNNIAGTSTWGLNTTISTGTANVGNMAQNNASGVINLTGVISGSGGIVNGNNSGGVGGVGQGTVILANTNNSFTGPVGAAGGKIYFNSLAPAGQNSSLGSGSSAIGVGHSYTSYPGTLVFTGTNSGLTDRALSFANNNTASPTFNNNSPNNSSLEFDGAMTFTDGGTNNVFTTILGGSSTGTNTFTGTLYNATANAPAPAVVWYGGLQINGPGTWIFDGASDVAGSMSIASTASVVLGYNSSYPNSGVIYSAMTLASGGKLDLSSYDQNNSIFILGNVTGYPQTLTVGRHSGSGNDIIGSLSLNGQATATVNIAGIGIPGTLTISSNLVAASGNFDFDLSANAATVGSGVNDLILIGGNLDLSEGIAQVSVDAINGSIQTNMPYTLFEYSGSLIGGSSGLSVPSPTRTIAAGVVSTATPGLVQVTFGPSGLSAANLVWQGNINQNWDLATTANWLNGLNRDVFYNGDSVTFNDSSSQTNVNILQAIGAGSITVSNSLNNYVFASTSGGAISGGSLLKQGTGELAIRTANSFAGGSVVSSGTLSGGNSTAFGTGTITLGDTNTGSNTARLLLSNTITVTNQVIVSSNASSGNLVIGLESAGNSTFSGPLVLQRSVTFSNSTSSTLFNLGGISGNGDVVLSGGNAANSYHWQSLIPTNSAYNMSGNLILTNGAFLDTQGGSIITNTANLIMASNTIFAIALNPGPYTNAQVCNALIGSGVVESGPGVTWNLQLTVGAGNGSGTFSGSISNYQTYYVGLIKAGTGTETFTGNSSGSSGFTAVSGGVLAVNNTVGTGLGTGAVTINTGATLAGNGSIYSSSNTVTVNGILSVGNAGDTTGQHFNFTNTGGIFINSGGSLNIDLFSGAGAGDNSGNAAAADFVNAQCPVTLNSGSVLNVSNLNGMTAWAAGDKWKIANWQTVPTGTFTVLNLPTLPSGLSWDTSALYTTGVIAVTAGGGNPTAPANITGVILSGGNLIITGTNLNGGSNFHYEVLSSTNLTLPLTNWPVLSTNSFNADGTFNYTNVINPNNPSVFFDVKAVQ